MKGTVAQTQPLNERPHNKARFVYRGLTVPLMLHAFCFAAWGSAANLTHVMVGVFRHIFVISNARSALIQTAYYGGYFSLASPRPSSTSGSSYKTHVLTGLRVAALGAGLSSRRVSCSRSGSASSPSSCWQPGCRPERPRSIPS
jgi:FHS family L-fucose permease-like MFS transporter